MRLAALTVIPVGMFVIATLMRNARGPYSLGTNSDPDYAYLLNALNIVGLQAPNHIDHPGTPLQMLGGAILVARWLPSQLNPGGASLQDAVLTEPEVYLAAISIFLSVLVSVTTFVVGFQAYRTWGALLPALAVQLSPFLFTQVPLALPRVTPEPLLIAAALTLLTLLIPLAGGKIGDTDRKRALLIGTVLGFGIATKITFVPLIALVLLVRGWGSKLTTVLACAVAFVVFTAPIVTKYKYLLDWLQSLATHTGTNGSGDVGVPTTGTIVSNLGFLFGAATPLFFLLGIYAVILVGASLARLRFRAQDLDGLRPVLLVSCIVIGAQIAVTLKNVGDHYLLPAMMVCALANGCIVLWAGRIPQRRLLSAVLPIGAAGALLLAVFAAGKADYQQAIALRAYVEETLAFDQQLPHDAIVVGYYRSSLPGYALAFGNYFAGGLYGPRLRELYPNVLFYDIWRGQFYSFVADVPDEEVTTLLRGGKTILLYGSPFVGDYEVYQGALLTEPILIEGDRALYRLVGIGPHR